MYSARSEHICIYIKIRIKKLCQMSLIHLILITVNNLPHVSNVNSLNTFMSFDDVCLKANAF